MLVHFFWPCHLIVIKYPLIPFTFWTYCQGLIFTAEADLWKIWIKDLRIYFGAIKILDQEMDTVGQSHATYFSQILSSLSDK